MRYTFKHIINSKDTENILCNSFELPKVVFDFIPKNKKTLLQIVLPNVSSNIYSVVENQNLILEANSITFFKSLSENEILFIDVNSKYNSETDMCFKIYFSKVFDFSDLKIENTPIISNELISHLKELELLV